MENLPYLSQINLLKGLDDEELERSAEIAPMDTVPEGTLVMSPEDDRQVLYLLKKGYVRLFRVHPEGREITVGLLRPGNIFGETSVLSTGTHDTYAEAMSDAVLCVIHERDLQELMRRHPELASHMVQILSDRLRELEVLLERLSLHEIQSRLLFLLVHLAEHFGVEDGEMLRIDLPLSHEDVAHMVASTRETVSLTLGELRREGVVQTGRRQLWIDVEEARRRLEML